MGLADITLAMAQSNRPKKRVPVPNPGLVHAPAMQASPGTVAATPIGSPGNVVSWGGGVSTVTSPGRTSTNLTLPTAKTRRGAVLQRLLVGLNEDGTAAASTEDGRAIYARKPQLRRINSELQDAGFETKLQPQGVSTKSGRTAPRIQVGKLDPETTVDVPSVVPPQYRKAVAKHGQRLNAALRGTGVTGPEYLGNMIQFESGWDEDAHNPSGAHGLGQFMPYTRDSFVSQYGVDPYGSPKQAIKAASMHASGDYGHDALYAGYNPGYSSSDPIMALINGDNVGVKMDEDKLKRVGGGMVTGAGRGGGGVPEQAKGNWGGAQPIVRELLGRKLASQADWKDKEDRGYDSLHDIETNPNALAADLVAGEGGLSLDQITDKIAKRLGRENPGIGPESVDYGTTGLESGLTYKGYDIEFLPYRHGSGDHVHIGAEWNGGSLPSGAVSGGPTAPVGGAGMGVPAAAAGAEQGGSAVTDLLLSQFSAARDQREARTSAGSALVRNPLSSRAAMPVAPSTEAGAEQKPYDSDEELMAELEYGFTPRRRRPPR